MEAKIKELLNKKNERKMEIMNESAACEDVERLRALNSEMDDINEEIRNLNELLDNIKGRDDVYDPDERTAAVNSQIPSVVLASRAHETRASDGDVEYRTAFMNYVTSGMPIPSELRANANTTTSDVGAVIPVTLVNKIIEAFDNVGMILPLVTRTSYAAGVKIPTSTAKPVATWVSEGAGSDRQKKTAGAITFTYHKLRCEISMSMEVGTMALSAFEASFVNQVSQAMIRAIEEKIVSTSDGASCPKGILSETPNGGQSLTFSGVGYDLLAEAEAAIPQGYEAGAKWCMSKKTFMSFIGMTDDVGQPIARINYGIGGSPERTLLGRQVVLCDYIDSYSAELAAGKIFAFIFDFSDYILNTVYDMGIQRKQDWETEDFLTKAVMSVDGKVVDKGSLVTVAKANASA